MPCGLLRLVFCVGSKRFSSKRRTTSMMTAMSAIGMAPARMNVVPSVALVPRMTMSPSVGAPMNEPTATTPMATTSAMRMPPRMTDSDSGSSIMRSTWLLVMPIPLPASLMLSSTP